jgi:hypothetical protein
VGKLEKKTKIGALKYKRIQVHPANEDKKLKRRWISHKEISNMSTSLLYYAFGLKKPSIRTQPNHWLQIARGQFAIMGMAGLSAHIIATRLHKEWGKRVVPLEKVPALPASFGRKILIQKQLK